MQHVSPYRQFSRLEWARLRKGTPLTLTNSEIEQMRGLNDPVSSPEVVDVYLPLSRLLKLYFKAKKQLFDVTKTFLTPIDNNADYRKVPYIIGISGSVACGKSTTARLLQALIQRWPSNPKVSLVTTDGFLWPNKKLEQLNLMERKGFPASYDTRRLLQFLSDIKAGKNNVKAPVYSHHKYDIIANEFTTINQPDILLLEGLNILQTGSMPADGRYIPFVSDFLDFSIYIDAEEQILERWYIERFMRLRDTSFQDSASYFNRFARLDDNQAKITARDIWRQINLKNLKNNILPTRPRAKLILTKGDNHAVTTITFRKI